MLDIHSLHSLRNYIHYIAWTIFLVTWGVIIAWTIFLVIWGVIIAWILVVTWGVKICSPKECTQSVDWTTGLA